MSKPIIAAVLFSCAALAADKTPVDLMREGRIAEARRIIEQSKAPERFSLLLDAISEPNAIEACFLYREISSRFPGTECDAFAQDRLLQAAELGIDISALVLEQPSETQSELHGVAHTYEVERPLVVSTTVPEDMKAPYPVIESKSEPLPKQQREITPARTVERIPIASTSMPESKPAVTPDPIVAPLEEKVIAIPSVQSETKAPAGETSGITLDYGIPAKTDTTIKQAALMPDQSMIRNDRLLEEKAADMSPAKAVEPIEPANEIPHDIEPDGGEWYIQVGAFGSLANADNIAAKLRSAGYRVVLVPFDEGERHLMQVRVGGYSSKSESRKIGDEIHEKFKVPAVLVTQ